MHDKFYKTNADLFSTLYGWRTTYQKPEKGIIAFKSIFNKCHLEVYIRSKKIVTCMEHPKGTTILERNNIGISEMRDIFTDPRIHTKKGTRI